MSPWPDEFRTQISKRVLLSMKHEYLLLSNNICLSVLAFYDFQNVKNFMAQ